MTKNELRNEIKKMIDTAQKAWAIGDHVAKTLCPEGDNELYDLLWEIQEGSRTDTEEVMTVLERMGYAIAEDEHRNEHTIPVVNNDMPQKVVVNTPMGKLSAYPAGDSEHPGIWISIQKDDEEEDAILLAEYCSSDYNSTTTEKKPASIMLRVYRQGDDGWAKEEPSESIPYWEI